MKRLRFAALLAVLALGAAGMAGADPPKPTLYVTNGTSYEARVVLNSPTTPNWSSFPVAPGVQHVTYSITGAFKLTGHVVVNGAQMAIAARDVSLKDGYPVRLTIVRAADGRYVLQ